MKSNKRVQLEIKESELSEEKLEKVTGGATASYVYAPSIVAPGPRRLPGDLIASYTVYFP